MILKLNCKFKIISNTTENVCVHKNYTVLNFKKTFQNLYMKQIFTNQYNIFVFDIACFVKVMLR